MEILNFNRFKKKSLILLDWIQGGLCDLKSSKKGNYSKLGLDRGDLIIFKKKHTKGIKME